MSPRRKLRLLTVCGILAGVAVTLALVLYALRSGIDLFYTPTEILFGKHETQQKPSPGEQLRIGGLVMPGTIKRDLHTLNITFRVYDGKNSVQVNYTGILPDLFREGQGVVAQGVFKGNGVITAQQVLAKHDENYTPPDITDGLTEKARQSLQQGSITP
ncbi:cytochrome c maturation protein CcmE [Scandinavium sp. M-37]|uniref:cytochrome c maturation protein CcmE n=1 Tax=Scandinavium sp. M-37 TaxID=3373077 RepID=UPI003745E197